MSYLKRIQELRRKASNIQELPELQPQELSKPVRNDESLLSGRLAYRLATPYGHVWLVADDQAKDRLQADGVTEAVYTIQEAQEFIKLPVEQRACIHTWKAGLSGTVEAVQEVHQDILPTQESKYRGKVIDYKLVAPDGVCTFQSACSFRTKDQLCSFPLGCKHRSDAADAKDQVPEKPVDTFKYRVVRPLELHGKSHLPGDVLELPADDAQVLLQDGSVQATCWWSRNGDFSSEGYK
jgi:hypothetical protein